jgi:hypothetical protein
VDRQAAQFAAVGIDEEDVDLTIPFRRLRPTWFPHLPRFDDAPTSTAERGWKKCSRAFCLSSITGLSLVLPT